MSTAQSSASQRFSLGVCPQTTDFNKTKNAQFQIICNVLATSGHTTNLGDTQSYKLFAHADRVCAQLRKRTTGFDLRGIKPASRGRDSEALLQAFSKNLQENCQDLIDSEGENFAPFDKICLYKDMDARSEELSASDIAKDNTNNANKAFDDWCGYHPQQNSRPTSVPVVKTLTACSSDLNQSEQPADASVTHEPQMPVNIPSVVSEALHLGPLAGW